MKHQLRKKLEIHMSNRTITNIQRVLFTFSVILVITLIPVWLLIVNATRSTLEIQQGISLFPSKYLITNYKILLA